MARSRRGRGGSGRAHPAQARDAREMAWFRADLHIHTPASADYQDMDATYLHILQAAEERGLDIVAFTDHNTVSGIATMRREIEDLELLEHLGRLSEDERTLLAEYRRVLARLLLLPGFEFSAAYGFHLLALFPPETSVRKLEHLLLLLDVPEEQMEMGSSQVGATADVLTAYEVIAAHGGLVIPAHVNAAHGVAAPGFRFGGQTKIAYTQAAQIAALEVTDLADVTRNATASFFNGTKPEYPRRMHCIQGSDAHRISREGARRDSDLGIGDRATEVLLPERTFAALKDLFASDDFARTRPYQPAAATPHDPVQAAREQGPTITQAFHEQVRSRRSRYRPILKEVVAFANTNGGTIYVGVSANPSQPAVGVPAPEEAARGLREAIARSVVPALAVTVDDTMTSGGKPVLIVTVPKGLNTPYATDAGQVFVRQEGQSVVALRDEIVQLVREAALGDTAAGASGGAGERVWSSPRAATESDEEGDEADETAALAAPAPAAEPEAEQPAAVATPSRRPRRRRPRPRPETPEPTVYSLDGSQTTAPETAPGPQAEDTAALDLAAALPGTATDAEPATAGGATMTAQAEAPVTAPPAAAPKPRRRTRTPKAAPAMATASTEEAESLVAAPPPLAPAEPDAPPPPVDVPVPTPRRQSGESVPVPKSGVEVLAVAERDGERSYTLRDLRGGRVLDNVTRRSARRLWRIAVLERERGTPDEGVIRWHGDLGYVGSETRDGVRRYTLAARADGAVRFFYAVGEEGITDAWRAVIPHDDSG